MFQLRTAKIEDSETLVKFAKQMNFINLPQDKSKIEEKIENSLCSFNSPKKKLEENNYIFVLDDLEKKQVIGCSMIHGKHGTKEKPHLFLKINREELFSHTLNKKYIHRTLQLGNQSDGYSEIGGLFLDPTYRGHSQKLGKQLSYIRFLYMGLHKEHFTKLIHVELMPPLDNEGNSPLWEELGQKFIPMDYKSADILSQENKEFILSLFPPQVIFETLLSQKAQSVIGQVGQKTLPVKKMLESIGFSYTNEIDPLDGGPHYRASLEDITLVKKYKELSLKIDSTVSEGQNYMIMSLDHTDLPTIVIQGQIKDRYLITNSPTGDITNGQKIATIPF